MPVIRPVHLFRYAYLMHPKDLLQIHPKDLWGPTRESQCFYDVLSQGVDEKICERKNSRDECKRDA
jgi:hypothetical protein